MLIGPLEKFMQFLLCILMFHYNFKNGIQSPVTCCTNKWLYTCRMYAVSTLVMGTRFVSDEEQ